MHDLAPAARQLADLLGNINDDALAAPTPCSKYTLGDLLDHVGGLTVAFTQAAEKASSTDSPGPSGDAARLGDDWRARIPRDLDALVAAWRQPEAWTGMTAAGGIEMPGEIAGLVALDELVVHGWDVARATGQSVDYDDDTVTAAQSFVAQFSGPGQEEMRGDAFAPVVQVGDDASPLDHLVAMSGRDPSWSRP